MNIDVKEGVYFRPCCKDSTRHREGFRVKDIKDVKNIRIGGARASNALRVSTSGLCTSLQWCQHLQKLSDRVREKSRGQWSIWAERIFQVHGCLHARLRRN